MDARDQPTQVEPVRLGELAARDGDEAREPRLRGQEIVVGDVQAAGALGVGEAIADRENPALRVVEEPEAHSLGEGGGPAGQVLEARLPQSLGERHERAREVPAVDRRDVAGEERRQALRVVPVEQVPLVPLQALHGREGGVDLPGEGVGVDEAEVVSGQGREEPHPDVGGRGPMGDPGLGGLLEVVGGQMVVLGAHEGLEVAPRVAGDALQEGAVLGPEFQAPLRHGLAQGVGDEGCDGPQRQHRQGRGERARTRESHEHEAQDRDERARDHRPHEGAGAVAVASPLGARRGRLPLQQAPLGGRQPDEREADRVHSLPGLAREERQLQAGLRQRGVGVFPHHPKEDAPRLLRRRAAQGLERQRVEAEGERGQDRGRPEPGASREDRPGEQQQGHGRGRHQAAPQVVQDLPAGDERQAVAAEAGAGGDDREQPPQDLPVAAHPAVLAARVSEDARRIVVDHLDVGDESRARVQPLEEVVREESVLGNAPLEGGDEGIHVVEPLAGEDPLGEEVLVRVGDRGRVGVDAGVPGVEPREERAGGARHGHAHPGLEDPVALGDAARDAGRSGAG